jgi:hypothetical protein
LTGVGGRENVPAMRFAALAAGLALVLVTRGASGQPAVTPPTPSTPGILAQPAASPSGGAVPSTAGTIAQPTQPRDIVIETPGKRSRTTDLVLAGVAGAAVVVGALGLYWNLDARSAADTLTAVLPTGLPWTAADQRLYERAHDSSVNAGVCYGIGGALLVGAVVGLIVTTPASEKSVIHPRLVRAVPAVAPTAGGLVAGGMWRF